MNARALRLRPGQDLYVSLQNYVAEEKLEAVAVLTCVGSLSQITVRFADKIENNYLRGPFEIVSLAGTLSPEGCHLHISFSDGNGITRGGHLKPGSIIHTTAEIILGVFTEFRFTRKKDAETGFSELLILKKEL